MCAGVFINASKCLVIGINKIRGSELTSAARIVLVGGKKGWTLVVGGNAASKPALAQPAADGLSDDEALAALSIDRFKSEVGL